MLESVKNFVNVRNLWIRYKVPKQWRFGYLDVDVIRGVSFSIDHGECYGLVGESGSGKTTILKAFMRLVKPYRGSIYVDGVDIFENDKKGREIVRRIGYVPQDPLTSVDPRMRVKDIVSEPLIALNVDRERALEKVVTLLELTGLDVEIMNKHPFELSGGMVQRVIIARSIISNPKIVLLDEPTSALDVITQAQILNLLKDLRDMMGFTYILVTHDLNVAKYISSRIGVLLKGYLIEEGDVKRIINEPLHPYTRIIVDAFRLRDVGELTYTTGARCPLSAACKYREDICRREMPPPIYLDGNMVRCWYFKK
ncbi:MAG: ABC transporter ATP-binding protein [Ignisphaera sp.]|nr:ABC transporter ATP-binding protein [Ignisphaera sp.]MCX8167601.1 ABC transporter ATP-binding protein [Ignisphaera sp.]MDW8085421.1 ABC transporter ATP-binding protein [Ignisphaera sp.]